MSDAVEISYIHFTTFSEFSQKIIEVGKFANDKKKNGYF